VWGGIARLVWGGVLEWGVKQRYVCGEAVCLCFSCDWVCTAAPDHAPRTAGRLWAPRHSNPSSGTARHRQLQRISENGCRDWQWRCAREDLLMRAWGGCSSGRHAAGAEWHAHGHFVGKTAILQMTRPLQDASDLPARGAHDTLLGLLRIDSNDAAGSESCDLWGQSFQRGDRNLDQ